MVDSTEGMEWLGLFVICYIIILIFLAGDLELAVGFLVLGILVVGILACLAHVLEPGSDTTRSPSQPAAVRATAQPTARPASRPVAVAQPAAAAVTAGPAAPKPVIRPATRLATAVAAASFARPADAVWLGSLDDDDEDFDLPRQPAQPQRPRQPPPPQRPRQPPPPQQPRLPPQPQQPCQPPPQPLSFSKKRRQLEQQKQHLADRKREQEEKWKKARTEQKKQRTGQPSGQAARPPAQQPAGHVRTLADPQQPGPSKPPTRPAGNVRTLADLPPSRDCCARCRKAGVSMVEALGKLWHPNCFLCAACQQPAGERFYQVPGWDELPYCQDCSSRRQNRCLACNRPSSSSQRQEDGRRVCSACQPTAIRSTQDAQTEYGRVQRFFSQQGLALPTRPALEIVAWGQLQQQAAQAGRQGGWDSDPVSHTSGLCLSEVITIRSGGRVVDQQIRCTGILVARGMPALLTGATIAHECMHALLRMYGLRSSELSDLVEEGLAQLMALLYLQHREAQGLESYYQKRLCTAHMLGIRQDSSYVYGEGFRAAHAAYQRLGSLARLVEYVRRKHRFPV